MVVPTSNKREQVLKLIEEKDKLEAKINTFGQILAKNNNIGMTESLVDAEGYPRSDINVYEIRHARHEIICLQNDLKQLMKLIEKGLEEVHAEGAHIPPPKFKEIDPTPTVSNVDANRRPIVRVNLVSPNSPADEAGLLVRDEILEFGTINDENFSDLGQIGELVRHSQNKAVPIKVRRDHQNVVNITLTPKTWSGRGLLGCNIVPVDERMEIN